MDARGGHPAAARAGALCISGCGAQPLQRRKVWDCTWRSGLASWMRRRSGSVSISTKVPRQRGHSAEPCPFRPNRPCAGTRIIVTARHTQGQSHQVWQGGCCELARAGTGLDLAGEERRRARGDYPAAVVAIQRLRLLRRLRDCVRRGGAECNRGRASHPGRDAKPAGFARRGGAESAKWTRCLSRACAAGPPRGPRGQNASSRFRRKYSAVLAPTCFRCHVRCCSLWLEQNQKSSLHFQDAEKGQGASQLGARAQ